MRIIEYMNSINPTEQVRHKSSKLVQKHIGLDPDERILLLAHKHWMVFRDSVLLALFCPFVLLFLVYLINSSVIDWPENIVHWLTVGLFSLSAIAFVAGTVGFLWRFYIWRNTFYVMTSKKLAIINQHLPWEYEVQQISLNNINDVTLKQEGVQSLLYGYSDVTAITFSGSRFTFKDVGKASDVQKSIMQQLALQKRPEKLPQVNGI